MQVQQGKRKSLRIPVNFSVRCDLTGGTTATGEAQNLSTGGLFLKTTDLIVIRESLTVEFLLPNTPTPILTSANALWCHLHHRGLHKENPFLAAGIRFVNLEESYLNLIQAYVMQTLRSGNIMPANGILRVMGNIRDLPPPERLRAYHMLLRK